MNPLLKLWEKDDAVIGRSADGNIVVLDLDLITYSSHPFKPYSSSQYVVYDLTTGNYCEYRELKYAMMAVESYFPNVCIGNAKGDFHAAR